MLSFIIPVYNKEDFLQECIESLLNIRCIDIEIILVDDGSKDASLKICQEYAKNHSRVIVISQENQGVSAARNTGLKHASGEYISFVDADDFVKETFENQLTEALKNNVDFYQFNYTRYISENKQSVGNCSLKPGCYENMDSWIHQIAGLEVCAMCVAGAIYKNDIINRYALAFKEGMKTCEDFLFNIQYLRHCNSFYYSDRAGFCYRLNPKSVTNNRSLDHARDYSVIFNEILQYIKIGGGQNDFALLQSRWIRWTIDLIANLKLQGISNKQIKKEICKQDFFLFAIGHRYKLKTQTRVEQILIRNRLFTVIKIYHLLLYKIKSLLGRYAL